MKPEVRYCYRETFCTSTTLDRISPRPSPSSGRYCASLVRVKAWTFYHTDGTTEQLRRIEQ